MPTPTRLLNLLRDMMSNKGIKITTTVEENGQPRQVEQSFSNLSVEEALKKLDIIVGQKWPGENELSQRLADFRNLEASPQEVQPKELKTRFDQNPEEMKQRLTYSKLCYQAMRPVFKRRAEQEKLWSDLQKSLPELDANGATRPKAQAYRIGTILMRTDGTEESEDFNDKVFSLLAIASHALTWDEFEERRYQSGLKRGLSEKEAKDAAKQERNYGMDGLVDIYNKRVDKSKDKREQAKKAAGMILSGKETNLKKLTDAFELINDDGFELMFVGGSAYSEFQEYVNNYAQRKTELEKQAKGLVALSVGFKEIFALAQEVISPYYAYLDPMDLFNSNVNQLRTNDTELRLYTTETYAATVNGIQLNVMPALKKYGSGYLNMAHSTTEMLVYEGEHSEIRLIGVDDLGIEQGIQLKINENVPGRYVDAGLDQDMKQLQEQYQAAAGKKPSNAFAAIGAALGELYGDHLGEKAETADRHRIGRKLHDLQKATADYLAVDKDFVIDGDEACSAFAKVVKEFADKKLGQLDLVDQHVNTIQQQAGKDAWEKDTNQRLSQNVRAGEQDAARYGKESEEVQQDWSDERIGLYIDSQKDKYISPKAAATVGKDTVYIGRLEAENDTYNKNIVAANVVKELLNSEEKLFPNSKDRSMLRQLSSGGSVAKLVHMVRESESFFENVRALDLSDPDARDQLLKDGVHKEVAKDILKTVMKQAISQQKETRNKSNNITQKQRTTGSQSRRRNSVPQPKTGKSISGLH